MRETTRVTLFTVLLVNAALIGGCQKRAAVTGEGARSSAEAKACPASEGMLTDAETNSNQISTIKGRGGYVYTFGDSAGSAVEPAAGATFSMTEGGASGSKYALRMKGTVGTGDVVYAGMGLNFVDPKGAYDASAYKGIAFWAKKGAGSTANVRLKVPDGNTDPDGKVCTACFNDFGMDLTLTDDWQQFSVPFSALKQLSGWGAPHPPAIDPTKLYGVQFQVNDKGKTFDIWVDDVQFVGCT